MKLIAIATLAIATAAAPVAGSAYAGGPKLQKIPVVVTPKPGPKIKLPPAKIKPLAPKPPAPKPGIDPGLVALGVGAVALGIIAASKKNQYDDCWTEERTYFDKQGDEYIKTVKVCE